MISQPTPPPKRTPRPHYSAYDNPIGFPQEGWLLNNAGVLGYFARIFCRLSGGFTSKHLEVFVQFDFQVVLGIAGGGEGGDEGGVASRIWCANV